MAETLSLIKGRSVQTCRRHQCERQWSESFSLFSLSFAAFGISQDVSFSKNSPVSMLYFQDRSKVIFSCYKISCVETCIHWLCAGLTHPHPTPANFISFRELTFLSCETPLLRLWHCSLYYCSLDNVGNPWYIDIWNLTVVNDRLRGQISRAMTSRSTNAWTVVCRICNNRLTKWYDQWDT